MGRVLYLAGLNEWLVALPPVGQRDGRFLRAADSICRGCFWSYGRPGTPNGRVKVRSGQGWRGWD